MKTKTQTAASILAFSLAALASGAALADWPVEGQYSVYHLASEHNASVGQAGPAGPASIPGLQVVADWPVESAYSVYHLAATQDKAAAAQAGRVGPSALDGAFAAPANVELWNSIYDRSANF